MRLRRQPHPEDFWPDGPPSGAICRSDIAAESVEARSLKSNAVTLERLRGVTRSLDVGKHANTPTARIMFGLADWTIASLAQISTFY